MILEDNVKRRFGLALRNWRKKSGISQEELAQRANLHRTYVSGIETGERNPSLESIEKLAKALKLPIYMFFQSMEDTSGLSSPTSAEK